MGWLEYATLCAFFLATSDLFAKKALKDHNEYVVAWGRLLWASPFILCLIPFCDIPQITSTFWITLLVLLPIEITAIILYTKAIKISPLSITIPFLGLTPIFLIFTSFAALGELPDKSGLLGIVLVALGAYTLNINQARVSWSAPLRAVAKEKGSLLMVAVAAIYSLTAILGKIGSQNSSPLFFCMIYIILIPVCLFPIVCLKTTKAEMIQALRNPNFVLFGFFYGLMILCHMQAVVLVEVSYMISVKRSSLLFSILYGRLIFKEGGFIERLSGGCLILAGILFITLL